jgi:hypothetical protein
MTRDISPILAEWEYQPGQLAVRIIAAEDGEPRLQVRLDLGLLQMHLEGRPDGQAPFGFRSFLDYFQSQFDGEPHEDAPPHERDELEAEESGDEALAASGPDSNDAPAEDVAGGGEVPGAEPGESRQTLTPEDCRSLREELSQYNQRAVALSVMEDHERVLRDATRNLAVLDLCKEKADLESDRVMLEQYRSYFIAMRYRAMASMAVRDNEPKAAVVVIDEGLDVLKATFAGSSKPGAFDQSSEVRSLQALREGLVPQLPPSQKSELRRRLGEAIAQENYELAAILRDELKQLKD